MKMSAFKRTFLSVLASITAICGFVGTGLMLAAAEEAPQEVVIAMEDLYGDSWNGAALQVYADGVFVEDVTMEDDRETQEWSMAYDATVNYLFKWVKGTYDSECSFTILMAGEEVFSVEDCDEYQTGKIVYRHDASCEHDFDENLLCGVCNKTCGVEIFHDFDGTTCMICGFHCGVDTAHDWVKGACERCYTVCTHEEVDGGACTTCGFAYVYAVITEDGEVSSYYLFEDAYNALSAHSNATLRLLQDVECIEQVGFYEGAVNGVLTLDLNGYTWTLHNGLLFGENLHVVITDTSAQQTGRMESGLTTVTLQNNITLEVLGGTIYSDASSGIDMYFGYATGTSNVIVSGGTIIGHQAIIAHGESVRIKGGTLQGDMCEIYCKFGNIDLSQYPNPSGLVVYLESELDLSTSTIILPENYLLTEDEFLQVGQTYTIYHTNCTYDSECEGVCNVCKQETRKPAHQGGMATCTERAVCEICSKPYGSTSSIHIVENDRCIECGEETSIFVTLEDGTTKKFVTLEEAFFVLEENETNAFIQLGADAVLESDYALENDYTLDLNGFEISCTYIDLHGKWIIQDSSLEKTGKITTESAYVFVVYNEIIIYGGTFDGAFYLNGTETNPVSMVVYDGTFTGIYGVDIYSYATVTIYNATFENKKETFYFGNSVQSTLTVHHAKFSNGGYALYDNGEESVMASVDQVLATCAKAYDAEGNELPMTEGFTNDEMFEVKSTHNFGDWTTTKEATLNEAGEEERVCSDCQETETKEIPKLEPEKPSTSDSTSNTLAKKKGCGSVMDGGSISVCLLGMAAIFFKKKQKNN